MPYARSAETARDWATNRAIDLWVVFAGDLPEKVLEAVTPSLTAIREDGGLVGIVAREGERPSEGELAVIDFGMDSSPAPLPWGIFTAMAASNVTDVRKVGVVSATPDGIRAGVSAGCGAVVGLAMPGQSRSTLVLAEPDHIVEPAGFGAFYAERYGTGRENRQLVLLNPGPSVTTDRVHRAIGGPDMCHREPEYSDLLDRVRVKLLNIAGVGDDWAMAMLAGSGTSALEAMVLSSVRPGRKLLVCRNGTYGDRAALIAERAGIGIVSVRADDLTPIDPAAVEAALAADPEIDAVFVVHHETTTGLLNPVHAIADAARRHNAVVAVDAISSFGAEDLPLAGTGIDMVASTSNKCLHGLPGAAFVLISPRGQERIAEVPPRSLYFDLMGYLKAQQKRTVPFTPAIPAIYGLDAALDELLDDGLNARQLLYQTRMATLDRDMAALGFEARVAPEHRSACVRSFPLPEGFTYDDLHDRLRAEGYVIYAGLGDAAKTTFRVCALGAMTVEAMEGFVATLAAVLSPAAASC
jgi:2-aminoethylphosphonate-pyruvate transaminase